jgi:hypothetical protein
MMVENKNLFKNKLIDGLACIFMYSICLFLFTACETNMQEELSSELPETSIAQDFTTPSSEYILETEAPDVNVTEIPAKPLIRINGNTLIERFDVPQGFIRPEAEEESFAYYLQNLPLKQDGAKVKYYDGREKPNDVYLAVLNFSLGDRDLQQCADAVIRLRAEYLYSKERYDEINFNFVSGFNAEFSKWAAGSGISVNGSNVSWNTNNNNNRSFKSFEKYLDIVYAYASTLSLDKQLIEKPLSDLAIGDVFIQGGAPGHCVIVVDLAVNETTGEKIFMLAQSYMPAQDIQILMGDSEGSPWFSSNIKDLLITPEWTFKVSDLKTW